MLIVIEVQ